MGRWAEKLKRERKEIEDKWDKYALLSIDSEGNLIQAVSAPSGYDQNEKIVSKAEEAWRKIYNRVHATPEHVHPLIHELLNTKKPFSLLINVEDFPQ